MKHGKMRVIIYMIFILLIISQVIGMEVNMTPNDLSYWESDTKDVCSQQTSDIEVHTTHRFWCSSFIKTEAWNSLYDFTITSNGDTFQLIWETSASKDGTSLGNNGIFDSRNNMILNSLEEKAMLGANATYNTVFTLKCLNTFSTCKLRVSAVWSRKGGGECKGRLGPSCGGQSLTTSTLVKVCEPREQRPECCFVEVTTNLTVINSCNFDKLHLVLFAPNLVFYPTCRDNYMVAIGEEVDNQRTKLIGAFAHTCMIILKDNTLSGYFYTDLNGCSGTGYNLVGTFM